MNKDRESQMRNKHVHLHVEKTGWKEKRSWENNLFWVKAGSDLTRVALSEVPRTYSKVFNQGSFQAVLGGTICGIGNQTQASCVKGKCPAHFAASPTPILLILLIKCSSQLLAVWHVSELISPRYYRNQDLKQRTLYKARQVDIKDRIEASFLSPEPNLYYVSNATMRLFRLKCHKGEAEPYRTYKQEIFKSNQINELPL